MAMTLSDRLNRKSSGAHYTPATLARYVARQIVVQAQLDKTRPIRALDPAVGEGELIAALLEQLKSRHIAVEAFGFDTNDDSIRVARKRVTSAFPTIHLEFTKKDFLHIALAGLSEGHLFRPTQSRLDPFDLVIANPPYVRTQVLGARKSQTLNRTFGLNGRVDLYQAFIKGIAQVLRPGGVAGIIVSNRFMTTRAGMSTRVGIANDFEILHVWDLGDTRIFEAAVLPAVLLLKRKGGERRRGERRFTAIYRSEIKGDTKPVTDPIDALRFNGFVRTSDGETLEVRHGVLDFGHDPSGVWRLSTPKSDDWLETVSSNSYCTFGDVGKVRVGVKTTADKIFVRADWQSLGVEERPELLRPLTTHHIARRYKALEEIPTRQILYPHEAENGFRRPVDITRFPRTQRYLEKHRSVLEGRKYVLEAGRQWYEIWVPQDPGVWDKPKVVFRDIAEHPTFWMDLRGTVVNGDCYWIGADNTRSELGDDLLWLILAVANSQFIEEFYDHRFHNKLYSGRRRFMTQYVEAFPLPDPRNAKSRRLIEAAKDICSALPDPRVKASENEIEALVYESFGVTKEPP